MSLITTSAPLKIKKKEVIQNVFLNRFSSDLGFYF